MNIGKKDAAWNFVATLLKIGSSLIVLPVIMRYVSRDEYGIWTIFLSYSALMNLVDFGFSNSFTRSVTYIFSGARQLQKEGINADHFQEGIDYDLLKSSISAMRFYYLRIALVFFLCVAGFGSWHLSSVLQSADLFHRTDIWFYWALFVCISSYQLYTYYYDALMMGRGWVQRQKQIVVLTQLVNIITIIVAVLSGLGLGAMVLGLVISVPLGRLLSRKCFYDVHIKHALTHACEQDRLQIIKTLSVNSVKLGFTLVGGFLVVRASVLIGSIYLPLADIAAFGLTRQLTDVVISVSSVWFQAFYPKITQYRTQENYVQVKRLYIQSWWFFVLIFMAGAAVILGFGNVVLIWIGSKTLLIPLGMGALMLFMAFLENNHVMAANLLLMENRVPFYKASLIAGGLTVGLMLLFFKTTEMGIWAMLLAPFIAQAIYQNWKWPSMIIRQYVIKPKDVKDAFGDALISLYSGIKTKFSGHVG